MLLAVLEVLGLHLELVRGATSGEVAVSSDLAQQYKLIAENSAAAPAGQVTDGLRSTQSIRLDGDGTSEREVVLEELKAVVRADVYKAGELAARLTSVQRRWRQSSSATPTIG